MKIKPQSSDELDILAAVRFGTTHVVRSNKTIRLIAPIIGRFPPNKKTETSLFINFVAHNSFGSLREKFYGILSFVDIKRALPKQEEVKELF